MSLDSTTLRMLRQLETLNIARPAGAGIKGDPSFWDTQYPIFPQSNADYWTPFGAIGLKHSADGYMKESIASIATLSGRGCTFDLLVNPDRPVFAEAKVGRKFFNGNDCWDLSTGREEFIRALEWALIDRSLQDVLLFNAYEHRLFDGSIGLFIDCINLSALMNADGDDQFDHQVCYTKASKRTSYKGTVYHYKTLRIKPSAIRSWKGRRATNRTTKDILREMKILSDPIHISSFDGVTDKTVVTPQEFCRKIETVY